MAAHIVSPRSKVAQELCEALNLGKDVVRFNLVAEADEALKVEVTYLVREDAAVRFTEVIKKHDLSIKREGER